MPIKEILLNSLGLRSLLAWLLHFSLMKSIPTRGSGGGRNSLEQEGTYEAH